MPSKEWKLSNSNFYSIAVFCTKWLVNIISLETTSCSIKFRKWQFSITLQVVFFSSYLLERNQFADAKKSTFMIPFQINQMPGRRQLNTKRNFLSWEANEKEWRNNKLTLKICPKLRRTTFDEKRYQIISTQPGTNERLIRLTYISHVDTTHVKNILPSCSLFHSKSERQKSFWWKLCAKIKRWDCYKLWRRRTFDGSLGHSQ